MRIKLIILCILCALLAGCASNKQVPTVQIPQETSTNAEAWKEYYDDQFTFSMDVESPGPSASPVQQAAYNTAKNKAVHQANKKANVALAGGLTSLALGLSALLATLAML